MKHIKVDCCEYCPLCHKEWFSMRGIIGKCQHPEMEDVELGDLSIIDPDCPLEDCKEGKT
jgi:hypothetical protein